MMAPVPEFGKSKRSGGPRTTEGRRAASGNALKTGTYARNT
jgi:hypothetical protein